MTSTLYKRKCSALNKKSNNISCIRQIQKKLFYWNNYWWNDKWDRKTYGKITIFLKTFFKQFRKLQFRRFRDISMVNDDGIASLNCEYTMILGKKKIAICVNDRVAYEDVMYSYYFTRRQIILI